MANSTLKLYYFDGKCRAEVARLILAAADKQYEDIRFNDDEWPKYKALMPFGLAPGLEVDGKMFAESSAINAFLAREFGFYGDNNLDALKIDQVVQLVNDLMNMAIGVFLMPEGAEHEKAHLDIKQEKSPKFLGHLEKLLKESGTDYFVGSKMTLVDIVVFDVLTGFLEDYIVLNDNFPLLQKHKETILAQPKIGPYMASRPKSDF